MGIFESLMSAYIKAPTGSQLEGVKENFIMKWGVPQCVGQLMAVLSPSLPLSVTILTTITVRDFTQYFYKLGVVDADYYCLDVCMGFGSTWDLTFTRACKMGRN